jgi:chromosome segregation ATPase
MPSSWHGKPSRSSRKQIRKWRELQKALKDEINNLKEENNALKEENKESKEKEDETYSDYINLYRKFDALKREHADLKNQYDVLADRVDYSVNIQREQNYEICWLQEELEKATDALNAIVQIGTGSSQSAYTRPDPNDPDNNPELTR